MASIIAYTSAEADALLKPVELDLDKCLDYLPKEIIALANTKLGRDGVKRHITLNPDKCKFGCQ